MGEPLYFESGHFRNGKLLWKAWLHQDRRHAGGDSPWLGWELRRVLQHFQERFDNGVGAWVRKTTPRLEPYFDLVGTTVEEAIVPNILSAQAGGRRPEACTRQEFQVTSKGLVAISLAFWSWKRHVARDLAGEVFRSLLFSMTESVDGILSDGLWQELAIHHVPPGVARECPMQLPREDDRCRHVADFLSIGHRSDSLHMGYADMLKFAYTTGAECCVMHVVVERQAAALARVFAREMANKGGTDSLALPLPGLLLENGRGKRRRVDEDLQNSLLHKAMQERRAPTVGALARSQKVVEPSTIETWVPKHLGAYRAALVMEFKSAGGVAVCFDAARFGQPKEDTIAYGILKLATLAGGWLAPQVLCGLTNSGASWNQISFFGEASLIRAQWRTETFDRRGFRRNMR